MLKGRSRNMEEDQVSTPTYDELIYICEKLHALYECVKRKHSSLMKNVILIEKTHNSILSELNDLKKALDELKSDKTRLRLFFFF